MTSADSNLVNSNIKDITGQRFGRLVVLRFSHVGKTWKVAHWFCRCKCGNTVIVIGKNLRCGNTKSCGCLALETSAKLNFKHGYSRRTHSRRYLYELWLGIRSRVLDPSDISFPTYGGIGIPMYEPWKTDSSAFINYILEHVGERPTKAHSIDRIVNALGYVPGNLRWLTHYEQNRNKTTNRMITANGETLCITDWAKRLGRSPRSIAARIDHLGWTPENAVTSNSKNKL